MKYTKSQAQAFQEGLHRILDGGGFKGRYYWDASALGVARIVDHRERERVWSSLWEHCVAPKKAGDL